MAHPRLSPGDHHRSLSTDVLENVRQRRALLEAARGSRAVQKRLVEWCRDDLIFYASAFVWQFDPSKRGIGAALPWITHQFQIDAALARPETHAHLRPFDRGILWCYENDRTMACEKSRWQGASWWFLIVQNWLCGFHDYVQTMNISRNESAVDDGTRNSLFWKLRYIQERQPAWLMGKIETTKLYFHFHRTRSEITGEASTAKAGVGGRASVIFVDEFPEIERAQEVREKTALTANCRFFNGTHLGVGTPFEKMCDARQSPEIVRIQMHWTNHPEQRRGLYEFDPARPGTPIIHDKSFEYPSDFQFVLDGSPTGGPRPGVRSPWYDAKCAEMGGDSRAAAMNLDIAPEGAARQFFDSLKIRQIIQESARPPLWIGDVLCSKRGDLEGLTECPQGRLRLWIRPKADGRLPFSKYTVGADVSGGTGATPSCLAGIDGVTSMKVLEWADAHMREAEFAAVTRAVCLLLADDEGQGAYLVWDSAGQQGKKFETDILALGYRNVYYNADDHDVLLAKRGQPVRRPGWYGTFDQKYKVLSDYRAALYDRRLIDRSEMCLLETLLFEFNQQTRKITHAKEYRSNDPSGSRENHSDMAVATGISWMLAKEFAEGGRRDAVRTAGPQPGTLGWLVALQTMQRQREEYDDRY